MGWYLSLRERERAVFYSPCFIRWQQLRSSVFHQCYVVELYYEAQSQIFNEMTPISSIQSFCSSRGFSLFFNRPLDSHTNNTGADDEDTQRSMMLSDWLFLREWERRDRVIDCFIFLFSFHPFQIFLLKELVELNNEKRHTHCSYREFAIFIQPDAAARRLFVRLMDRKSVRALHTRYCVIQWNGPWSRTECQSAAASARRAERCC